MSFSANTYLPHDVKHLSHSTCCFAGHTNLPEKKIKQILLSLNKEVDKLIQNGVQNFISGGVLGYDHIAASMVITKKQQGIDVRLIFALPYRNYGENWTDKQKQLFYSLLNEANDIHYISEEYANGCIKKRNRYLVDNSAYCICALTKKLSETALTVNYAKQQGLQIINVAK